MKRGPAEGSGHGVSETGAMAAWGADIPDWVLMLARMADRASQVQAGREIGYSGTVVNAVIKNSYNGSLKTVEKAVRGRFMSETVTCPVLGLIGTHICLEHQKRARVFTAGSSLRVAIARACRGSCPHSRIARSDDSVRETAGSGEDGL